MISEAEFEAIVDKLLEAGVPPTAIANAFEIDPVVVRERLAGLRVKKYGSSELAEALATLQWEALDNALNMVRDAPFNMRARFIMVILGKSMSTAARQTPESTQNMRVALEDLMTQMAVGSDDPLAAVDTSPFIPAVDANEDQDQGAQT